MEYKIRKPLVILTRFYFTSQTHENRSYNGPIYTADGSSGTNLGRERLFV